MEREALKLALEALENLYGTCDWHNDDGKEAMLNAPKAITAIKEALAQPAQQEPVAWMYQCTADNSGAVLLRHKTNWAESNSGLWIETPLYTTPPQREWVGLTDEEIHGTVGYNETRETYQFALALIAKLKEKNF